LAYGALVDVVAEEGRAAAVTEPEEVAGAAIVVAVATAVVGTGNVVVVANGVGAGVVGGSSFTSGLGSGFGSILTVGVTLKTVGGVDGSTTMMLGRGAAVAGTVIAGAVATGIVEDSGAASVLWASASTAFDVSLSLACNAASWALRSSLSFFAASVRVRSRWSRSEDRIFKYVAVIAVPADKIAAPKMAYAGFKGSRLGFVGVSSSSDRSSG
jgi:hypothetical protein